MSFGFGEQKPRLASEPPPLSADVLKSKEAIARAKTGESAVEHILSSGFLDVGEGQKIYYLEWGNPKGEPFTMLHGGPGAAFNPSHVALFDPKIHHVIFFDQRGCGESTPSAQGMSADQIQKTNTSKHLIKDTETLRAKFFGKRKVNIAGGSWGSTLALMYAIEHPDKVESMQLWSTYLATNQETVEMFSDRTANPNFPFSQEWQWFLSHIPENERYDEDGTIGGKRILTYLARMINDPDPEIARRYALVFQSYEYALTSPEGKTFDQIRADVASNPNLVSAARIEILYMVHDMFVPDGHILDNVGKIKSIPCKIVQGVRDWCTPPQYAHKLKEQYGKNCEVEIVDSGHLRDDPKMKAALQKNMKAAAKR